MTIIPTVRGQMTLARNVYLHGLGRSSIPGLGDRLRFRRIAMGWSQEDMEAEVRQCGCPMHRGRLSNYETNRQTPTLKTAMAFARALGCTLDALVYGDAPGP